MNNSSIHQINAAQFQTMRANFKWLRQKRNWSLQQLSQISKIDIKTLKQIENGEDFEIEFLFLLCHCYGIKPYEIFSPLVHLE